MSAVPRRSPLAIPGVALGVLAVLSAVLGLAVVASPAAAAPATIGYVGDAYGVNGAIRVNGWAALVGTAGSIPVSFWVNGAYVRTVTATVARPDVVQVYPWAGPNQGFAEDVAAPPGADTICAKTYDATLGCRVVTVGDPFGGINVAERTGPSTFRLQGWVIDPDINTPANLVYYVNNQPFGVTASLSRPDVDAVFHHGAAHGFDVTFNAGPDDQVCVWWVNTAFAGHNQLGGCWRDTTWGALPPPAVPDPGFSSSVSTVTAGDLGASWHSGCPVGPEWLRKVTVTYWGFDSQRHSGSLIVHVFVADQVVTAFRIMSEWRFPIERIDPVSVFGGSDDASMAADNTSAFNCRAVTGGSGFSQHSFGLAIDINPAINPYLSGSTVLPPRGANYLDRSRPVDGMLLAGRLPVSTFTDLGWGWGGYWASPQDLQHVSANNR